MNRLRRERRTPGGKQHQPGNDHPENHFDEKGIGLGRKIQQIYIRAANHHVAHLQRQVEPQQKNGDSGQRPEHLYFRIELQGRRGQGGFENHHGVAHRNGRGEEQQRQHGRIPQRVQLGGRDEHQRAQAGLVHAGQDHPCNNKKPHDLRQNRVCQTKYSLDRCVQCGQRSGQLHPALETFNHNGQKLDVEYVEVKHDTHGHLEQHRGRVPVKHGFQMAQERPISTSSPRTTKV